MIAPEWDVPFDLTTPEGVLPINQQVYLDSEPLGWFMLVPDACSTGIARRVTRTNIAQAFGEIVHKKFKTGYVMQLAMQLWENPTDQPACAGVLRQMVDLLMLHLNAIDNDDGRIQWTPTPWPAGSGAIPDRMLDKVRMLGPSGDGQSSFASVIYSKDAGNAVVTLTFAMLTPYPYATDVPETDTALAGGSTLVSVNNTGNAEYFPVFEIDGPTNSFVLTNFSNLDEQGAPKRIIYEGTSLPGGEAILGGNHAEIVTFWNTIYLNGNQDNLKPGIDVPNTDFWTLLPGVNEIQLEGASGTMKWLPAYA